MKCEVCGKEVLLPFQCSYCKFYFCADHRLPEDHDCPNLPTSPLFWYARRRRQTDLKADEKERFMANLEPKKLLNKAKRRVTKHKYTLRSHIIVKIGLMIFAALLFEYFFLKAYFNITIYFFVALTTIYLIYKLFLIASRIRVTSDLRLWGLRLLAGLVFIVGIILLTSVFMSSLLLALTPEKLDNPAFTSVFVFFGVLGMGLIFLSSYLAFRFMLKSGVIVYPR